MDDILDVLQLGCAVKLDRFQAVRLGSYIKKLQSENEALTKLASEKAMVHVSMNVAEIKAEAGRAGFIAGSYLWCDYHTGSEHKDDLIDDIKSDADQYAAKIRKGEL